MIDRSVLGASDRTDWSSLRLYGSFNAIEQRALEAGSSFPFGGMNAEQRKIVERIVFAGEIRSETQMGDGSAHMRGAPVEPTEAFPTGVPVGCSVTGRATSVPTLVAYGKGADGKVRPLRSLNQYTLATIETEVLGNPGMTASYGVPNLVGYAPGAEKLVALRVEVAPNIWKESAIAVADFDPNATPVPWDKLPDPLPKQIGDAIEQLRAQKAKPPTRGVPPPH